MVADSIALSFFFLQRVSGDQSETTILPISSKVLIVFCMTYGWFIISWMLVRRWWTKKKTVTRQITRYRKGRFIVKGNRSLSSFAEKAGGTVAAIGLLLLPLQMQFLSMLLPFDDPMFHGRPMPTDRIQHFMFIVLASLVTLAGIGAAIFLAMGSLMPVIYDDMENLS